MRRTWSTALRDVTASAPRRASGGGFGFCGATGVLGGGFGFCGATPAPKAAHSRPMSPNSST
jgi:hypothetical protein